MRFMPTRLHGVFDYLYLILIILSPWLFGFARGGAETLVPVIVGMIVLLYSLGTNYELGVMPRLGMASHLLLDGLLGAFLIASPWLFGFASEVWLPHVVFGVISITSALTTDTKPGQQAPRTELQENLEESPKSKRG